MIVAPALGARFASVTAARSVHTYGGVGVIEHTPLPGLKSTPSSVLFTVNTTAALSPVARNALAAIEIAATRILRARTSATLRGFTALSSRSRGGPTSAIYADC